MHVGCKPTLFKISLCEKKILSTITLNIRIYNISPQGKWSTLRCKTSSFYRYTSLMTLDTNFMYHSLDGQFMTFIVAFVSWGCKTQWTHKEKNVMNYANLIYLEQNNGKHTYWTFQMKATNIVTVKQINIYYIDGLNRLISSMSKNIWYFNF